MKPLIIAIVTYFTLAYTGTVHAFAISPDADIALQNIIYQIKYTIKEGYSPKNIEDWIGKIKNSGAKEYRLDNYAGSEIGWSVLDSNKREVASAIFYINNGRAESGKYYGAISKIEVARIIHDKHLEFLKTYYKSISNSTYGLDDRCIARPSFFTGSTGLGRTIIEINCK